jgi:regulator of RNase E activity RraB
VSTDTITIPEDLSTLSDSDLDALHTAAVDAFKAGYEGGAPTEDTALDALSAIAEGVEALRAETNKRDAARAEVAEKAKRLAAQVLSEGQPEADEEAEEADEEEGEADKVEPSSLRAAAARGRARRSGGARRAPININLGDLRSGGVKEEPAPEKPTAFAVAAQGAAGYDVGTPMSIKDMAKAINSRLGGFNASSYMAARQKNVRQSERFTIAKMPRTFAKEAVVEGEDPRDAMAFAANEANLPQGSLVASGGWCAPSETLYELAADISEAANLVSLPEIQVTRGGVRTTLGPDYRTVFEDTGFCYTEAEDIDGLYTEGEPNTAGTKPCVTVPCPDFEDTRLGYCGVCIGAGLLQQRGYPEVIEDYISKALTAHAHKMSASVINSMVAESTAVTFPAGQVGAAAPILTAIDLQAIHFRAINRMADDATLEVLLPTWAPAVLRADLARRLGVDLLDVSDARIRGWFTARNVNVQYVVDWQDVSTTAATAFTAFPGSIQFLLYAAGTFVKGVDDAITLENIYDSVLLGTNDYTALFTEDPFLVLKRLHDSRVVTVPFSADGATHGGVAILANGTSAAVEV